METIIGDYILVAEWIHFYAFWDNITHSKNYSVHFLGLLNSATKLRAVGLGVRV